MKLRQRSSFTTHKKLLTGFAETCIAALESWLKIKHTKLMKTIRALIIATLFIALNSVWGADYSAYFTMNPNNQTLIIVTNRSSQDSYAFYDIPGITAVDVYDHSHFIWGMGPGEGAGLSAHGGEFEAIPEFKPVPFNADHSASAVDLFLGPVAFPPGLYLEYVDSCNPGDPFAYDGGEFLLQIGVPDGTVLSEEGYTDSDGHAVLKFYIDDAP